MKTRSTIISGVLFVSVCVFAQQTKNSNFSHQSAETKLNPEQIALEKNMLALLKTYSPDGYTILTEYISAPGKYDGYSSFGDAHTSKWIEGITEYDLVKSANTVVHEMNHGYTSKLFLKIFMDEGKKLDEGKYSVFYLGNGEKRMVKHTPVFETKLINSIYPKELIFHRYKNYIYPSRPMLGAQQNGIYGLLDEFNAYYHGTKTTCDFFGYYLKNINNPDGWRDFLMDYYATFNAYLEFKTYILTYLIYAKQNNEDIYKQIIQNADFLYVFKKTDDNFTTLFSNFKKLKMKISSEMQLKGIALEEKDGYSILENNGVGNFSDQYEKFQKELKLPKYQEMAKKTGLTTAGGPDFYK